MKRLINKYFRSATIWSVLLGSALTIFLMAIAWRDTLKNEKQLFDAESSALVNEISQSYNIVEEVISSLAMLINSAKHVNRRQYNSFSREVLQNHPFLLSTAYFPLVSGEQRSSFETHMRQTHVQSFSISEKINEVCTKAKIRKQYLPLAYQEPQHIFTRDLIGFDALTDTSLGQSILKSIETGETTPAPVQYPDEFIRGYWLVKPIYLSKTLPATVLGRKRQLKGIAALIIDPLKMLNSLHTHDNITISMQVSAQETPQEHSTKIFKQFNLSKNITNPKDAPIRLEKIVQLKLRGQHLKFIMHRFLGWKDISYQLTMAALLVGTIITFLLALIGKTIALRQKELQNRNDEVERQVAQKTSALKQSNVLLKREIQERKQTEKRLETSEKTFRELFNRMSSGVVVYQYQDDGFIISDFNQAAEKIDNKSKEEVIGKKLSDVFPGAENFGIIPELEKVYYSGIPLFYPAKIYHDENGKSSWRENYIYKLPSGEVVAVYDDISERKQVEEELRQSQKMEAMGTLAGGIAHDFNNILTAILGFAELSKLKLDNPRQVEENLDSVIMAGNRAKKLVSHILAFSRKGEQERKSISIVPLINEAFKFLRASVPATIQFEKTIQTDCGTILADPTQIHQVIVNLCTNATQAMEKNRGTLKISLYQKYLEPQALPSESMLPGNYLHLVISDTGSGIEQHNLDRIFDPYFSSKEVGKGSGLGLAVVHGIVSGHDGFISVQSKPGEGTVFRVYFPIIESERKKEELVSLGNMSTGTEKILVVDDEPGILKYLHDALTQLGYKVVKETDGVKGLKTFQAQPEDFALVITDQTMPNMTGVELSSQINAIRPNIPIILTTGFSSVVSEKNFKKYGIHGFTYKPIDIITLSQMVRSLIDQQNEETSPDFSSPD